MALSWTVANLSPTLPAQGAVVDGIYASRSAKFDNTASLITTFYTGYNPGTSPLTAAGGTHDHYDVTNYNLTLPSYLGTGQFYLYVAANIPEGQNYGQGESDSTFSGTDANNVSAASEHADAPDLAVSNCSAPRRTRTRPCPLPTRSPT